MSVLDTGAIYPISLTGVAEEVGIPLPTSPNHPIQYGGSRSIGWRVRAYIEPEQHRLATDIVFVERLDVPYGLLGRRGVFSRGNEVVFLEKERTARVELRW